MPAKLVEPLSFLVVAAIYFLMNYLLFSGDLSGLGSAYYVLSGTVEFIFFFVFLAIRACFFVLFVQILSLVLQLLSLIEYQTNHNIIYNAYISATIFLMVLIFVGFIYDFYKRLPFASSLYWRNSTAINDSCSQLYCRCPK